MPVLSKSQFVVCWVACGLAGIVAPGAALFVSSQTSVIQSKQASGQRIHELKTLLWEADRLIDAARDYKTDTSVISDPVVKQAILDELRRPAAMIRALRGEYVPLFGAERETRAQIENLTEIDVGELAPEKPWNWRWSTFDAAHARLFATLQEYQEKLDRSVQRRQNFVSMATVLVVVGGAISFAAQIWLTLALAQRVPALELQESPTIARPLQPPARRPSSSEGHKFSDSVPQVAIAAGVLAYLYWRARSQRRRAESP